ncbi:MAG: hypothetical protein U1G07_01160 [Verrucomicrobiota bacterium]
MIPEELVQFLCCPETRQALQRAEPGLIAELNRQIGTAGLRNRAGRQVLEKLEEGLVPLDRRCLFPVRQEMPVLLPDEAIPLG